MNKFISCYKLKNNVEKQKLNPQNNYSYDINKKNLNPQNTTNYLYDINNSGYSISTIYNAYGIKPSTTDVKVGIIELGGGYLESDLEYAMSENGFPEWKASEHVFPYFIDGYPTNIEQNFYDNCPGFLKYFKKLGQYDPLR